MSSLPHSSTTRWRTRIRSRLLLAGLVDDAGKIRNALSFTSATAEEEHVDPKAHWEEVYRTKRPTVVDEFGPRFRLMKHRTELHQTPAGSIQQSTYCYCNISKALS